MHIVTLETIFSRFITTYMGYLANDENFYANRGKNLYLSLINLLYVNEVDVMTTTRVHMLTWLELQNVHLTIDLIYERMHNDLGQRPNRFGNVL